MSDASTSRNAHHSTPHLPQGAEPRSYPSRPFVGVGAVVFRGPKVLLVRRGKPPKEGHWSLPGGAQHLDETIEEAVAREVFEETGLAVRLTGLLDVVDFIDRDEEGQVRHHYTLVDWMAESDTGDARPGDDVTEVIWADPDDLDRYDLWDETRRVIALARTRRRAQMSALARLTGRLGAHGRVWINAALFGLGAYAVIHLLIVLIDYLKDWTNGP